MRLISALVFFTLSFASVTFGAIVGPQPTKLDGFISSKSGSIGTSATPAPSAILDQVSTTKGSLIPRMTTAQRTAIASPATGLQVYDTDFQGVMIYNGTIWARLGHALGTTTTLDASAALQVDSIAKGVLIPRMTTAQRNAIATPGTGLQVYNTDTNKLNYYNGGSWKDIGSGAGGAGGINYMAANPDAEDAALGVTGYVTFADAAATVPVDGVGGSPVATFTRTTSAPLRGTASFLMTKGATNRQGDGWAYDFTIDAADQAKLQTLTFDYSIASGTYADDDVQFFLFDKTNSALIYAGSGQKLKTHALTSSKQVVTFQTAYNSTSYRLIGFISSTSAVAYTLKFDNFLIGPQAVTTGPPITEWTPYTPTMQSFGAVSNNTAEWRRVGDSIQARGRFFVVSPAASVGYIGLPAGLNYDIAKANGTSGNYQSRSFGKFWRAVASNAQNAIPGTNAGPFNLTNAGASTNALATSITTSLSGNGLDLTNANNVSSAGDSLTWELEIPIQGWSSNVAMSSDGNYNRPVKLMAIPAASSTAGAGAGWGPWTVNEDTHGGFNSTTGRYTVKTPGSLLVSWNYWVNAANTNIAAVVVNGNFTYYGGQSTNSQSKGITVLVPNLKVGDTLDFWNASGSSITLAATVETNHLSIVSVGAGGQTTGQDEEISGSYGGGTTLFPTGGAATIPLFANKQYDSHGAYNPATGKVCVPAPGRYRFHAHVWISGWTPSNANNAIQFDFNLNGAGEYGTAAYPAFVGGYSRNVSLDSIYDFDLKAGDCVNADVQNGSSINVSMINNNGYSYIQWNRLK